MGFPLKIYSSREREELDRVIMLVYFSFKQGIIISLIAQWVEMLKRQI